MIVSEFDHFYVLAESTPPTDISAYVKEIGWKLEQRSEGAWEQWIQPREDGSPLMAWLLPLSRHYADYDRRMAQLLHAAAVQQSIDASELKSKLRHVHSDCFSIVVSSIDSEFRGGIFALPQISETLQKLIEDAARFTDHPQTSFRGGRRSIGLQRLLKKELTVETASGTDPGIVAYLRLPTLKEVKRTRSPFERKVLENLFRSVKWTYEADGSSSPENEEIASLGWQVCKTLADFSRRSRATSAQLSFAWSNDVPRDRDISTGTFHFEHLSVLTERVHELAGAASRPTYAIEPALASSEELKEVVFSGKIADVFLGPRPTHGPAECWISLAWKVGRQERALRVNLSEEDYLVAVEARLSSDEVSVEGVARPAGRHTWVFEGTLTLPRGRTVTVGSRPYPLP